ncbi:ABC transporter ATP-binding protein [Cucumibacter marinus]|uniref:ABC transporter ATP-binding protein n=1 Tax=Cucumibacter marinus TaxID=1121252 RepID=UPI0003FDA557|nr:ABC transporter ATP-binding protein [Cucumibacter marinus]
MGASQESRKAAEGLDNKENRENHTSLLKVENLSKSFGTRRMFGQGELIDAVKDVSFELQEGRTLSLVGESGSGKSTIGRMVASLIEPTSGRIAFEGDDLSLLDGAARRALRRRIQMVFQDPYSSLNPRHTVGEIVGSGLAIQKIGPPAGRQAEIIEILERVGLDPAHHNRYPREFSGGQRQRIGIARALIMQPKLLICDEPVSALDVSVQAQIVNLLIELQKQYNLAYLFIAHDLAVVRHISDFVAVICRGRLVEIGPVDEILKTPSHPYTKSLLAAVPIPDPRKARARRKVILKGDAKPSLAVRGCPFAPRCPIVEPVCRETVPPTVSVGTNHRTSCHFPDKKLHPENEHPAA